MQNISSHNKHLASSSIQRVSINSIPFAEILLYMSIRHCCIYEFVLGLKVVNTLAQHVKRKALCHIKGELQRQTLNRHIEDKSFVEDTE